MSLVADYGSFSDSDEEEDVKRRLPGPSDGEGGSFFFSNSFDSEDEEREKVQEKVPLPRPRVTDRDAALLAAQHSVFRNPYQEAAAAKTAVMQKHVKLSANEQAETINGRKICWRYRQG